jgi:uncharacterized protein YraI
MTLKSLAFAGVAATSLAIPGIAEAYWGQATGNVNMRTCGSTACSKILVVPAGAQVWIDGSSGSWYRVNYGGYQGFVSSGYVRTAIAAAPPPRPTVTFGFNAGRPPAPTFGFIGRPYWDSRYNAWYDGRRWYYNSRWYNAPPRAGFSIGFNFGG